MSELFLISPEALQALSRAEIIATVEALKEVGAYGLPYPEVDVGFQADTVINWVDDSGAKIVGLGKLGPEYLLIFEGLTETDCREINFHFKGKTVPAWLSKSDMAELVWKIRRAQAIDWVRNCLISLLAVRNAVKHKTENKPCKPGQGRANVTRRYRYVTRISPPQELEPDPDHPPTGATRAPHLRRGHVRNQRYGAHLAFTKAIFIAPIFVNADPDFVSNREAYNM